MKLKYRIKLAFLDWQSRRQRIRNDKLKEKELIEHILGELSYHKSASVAIYEDDIAHIALYEKCFQKIGISYTKKQIGNNYIKIEYGRS